MDRGAAGRHIEVTAVVLPPEFCGERIAAQRIENDNAQHTRSGYLEHGRAQRDGLGPEGVRCGEPGVDGDEIAVDAGVEAVAGEIDDREIGLGGFLGEILPASASDPRSPCRA